MFTMVDVTFFAQLRCGTPRRQGDKHSSVFLFFMFLYEELSLISNFMLDENGSTGKKMVSKFEVNIGQNKAFTQVPILIPNTLSWE